MKSVRNDVNRMTNAEIANQAKSSSAAVDQLFAIRTVLEAHGMENLPPALQEFIRLRDSSPAFDSVKAAGSIGIPCFVEEDGRISFDTEEFVPEGYSSGASCSIDGKGC